jgi:hypothetical protein
MALSEGALQRSAATPSPTTLTTLVNMKRVTDEEITERHDISNATLSPAPAWVHILLATRREHRAAVFQKRWTGESGTCTIV